MFITIPGHMASFLLFVIFWFPALADHGMTGKVVGVTDGNSLEVVHDNERYRIVLLGIDCPELSQPFGGEAAGFTRKRMLGREVVVRLYGKDRLKNYIGVVLLKGGRDVRLELLDRGLAWTAEKDPLPELEMRRVRACKAKTGLWREENPVPPWIYRRQQTMETPKSR